MGAKFASKPLSFLLGLIALALVSCSSEVADERLKRSLFETSLEGYGNYSEPSLESSATFLLHNQLSRWNGSRSRISSVYVLHDLLKVNIILSDLDFDGFVVFKTNEVVLKLDLDEFQKSYVEKRLKEVCYVTLRYHLSDEQMKLIEAGDLEKDVFQFSFQRNGRVDYTASNTFYIWSRKDW